MIIVAFCLLTIQLKNILFLSAAQMKLSHGVNIKTNDLLNIFAEKDAWNIKPQLVNRSS